MLLSLLLGVKGGVCWSVWSLANQTAEVQKAAENQKILEDEIFERLKTLEFQAEELKGIISGCLNNMFPHCFTLGVA